MLEIRLFGLGYIGDVNLNKVADLINVSPRVMQASVEDAIPNIGSPDIYGIGYSDARLISLYPAARKGTIRVGIILTPIQENFYTRSFYPDAIILSLFQSEELCEKAGRTPEEYIAISLLLMHVLWLEFKARRLDAEYEDLLHTDTRGCLFDFAIHKPDKIHKLRTGQICLRCKAKLAEANVPASLIENAEKMFERIRKPSLLTSLATGLRNPIFSFVLGGIVLGAIINVVSSFALGELDTISDYYVLLGLLGLAVIMVTVHHVRTLEGNHRQPIR